MAVLRYKDGRFIVKSSFTDADKCRSIIGGKWDKKTKTWSYPEIAIPEILHYFGDDLKMDDMTQIIIRLINNKINNVNKLKNGEIEPEPHPFLMHHQKICRDIAKYFDRYAFFLDTGTGKTITALQIIKDNLALKWVVVCPKSIIKPAWLADKNEFFPELRMLPLSKNVSKDEYLKLAKEWDIKANNKMSKVDIRNMLAPWAQIYIVNPESFKTEVDFLNEQGVKGFIFDESVKIKDPSTQITKATLKFVENMKKVYILSGKPAPNNELEYFTQMKAVDDGVFGNSYYKFRTAFFNPVGYMGYDWKLKDELRETFSNRLAMKSVFIDKDDCLDLPEKTYLIRNIELTGDALKYYKQMERDRLMQIDDSTVIAPNILTNIMKLRQITSGFVIDNEQEIKSLHTQKLDELMHVLDEIGDKQVVIWANFKKEIRMIEQELKKRNKKVVTAYSETANTDDSVQTFKDGKAQYIIAHPQTLKYGVTFTNCTYAIYYSLSYSYDDYYQSHDRIYRKGQTKPCTFIFLLCENTIDEVIHHVLQEKGDLSNAIKAYAKKGGK